MVTKDFLKKKTKNKDTFMENITRRLIKTKEIETKKDQLIEKKRKRKKEQNVDSVQGDQIPIQDNAIRTHKKKKGGKLPRNKRIKNVEDGNALVSESDQAENETNNGLNEENDRPKKARKKEKEQNSLEKLENSLHKGDADQTEAFQVSIAEEDLLKRKKGKSKEAKKKKESDSSKVAESQEKVGGHGEDDVYLISSGDEDCSKGIERMKRKRSSCC